MIIVKQGEGCVFPCSSRSQTGPNHYTAAITQNVPVMKIFSALDFFPLAELQNKPMRNYSIKRKFLGVILNNSLNVRPILWIPAVRPLDTLLREGLPHGDLGVQQP